MRRLLLIVSCTSLAAAASASSAPAESRLAAAARLVPLQTPFAAFVDGAGAAATVQPFLRALAGKEGDRAPGMQDVARALGVDLFSAEAQGAAGLAPEGVRVVVGGQGALGLSAPVAQSAAAKKRLMVWLEALGPPRVPSEAQLREAHVSGAGKNLRAAMVFSVDGAPRLLTASGQDALALLARLREVSTGPKSARLAKSVAADPLALRLLAPLHGPLTLLARGHEPDATGALAVDLEVSPQGLVARGLVLAGEAEPWLAGPSPGPDACAGSPLVCVRAAPGSALRKLAQQKARQLVRQIATGAPAAQPGAPAPTAVAGASPPAELEALVDQCLSAAQDGALLRIESLNLRTLLRASDDQLPTATPFVLASKVAGTPLPATPVQLGPLCLRAFGDVLALGFPCPETAPALGEPGPTELFVRFQPRLFLQSLKGLSPLDALRSPLAGPLFVAQTALGPLLSQSGPVELTVRPLAEGGDARFHSVELRWPLEGAAATPR